MLIKLHFSKEKHGKKISLTENTMGKDGKNFKATQIQREGGDKAEEQKQEKNNDIKRLVTHLPIQRWHSSAASIPTAVACSSRERVLLAV